MKSYNFFYALILVCAVAFVACDRKLQPDQPSPVNPFARHFSSSPDSILVYKMINGVEILYAVEYHQYNANGQIISLVGYNNREVLSPSYKSEYVYNAEKQLLEERQYMYFLSSASWIGTLGFKYTYFKDGKIESVQIDRIDNNTGENISANSIPLKKGIFSWSDNTHAEETVYAFHAADTAEVWQLADKGEFVFNTEGRILNEKYCLLYYKGADVWMETTYEYDQYGNPLSYSFKDGERDIEKKRYTYSYDSEGHILTKYTSIGDSSSWKTKEIYCY